MKPDKVIEELHLKTYEYVQNQNSFVHLGVTTVNGNYCTAGIKK